MKVVVRAPLPEGLDAWLPWPRVDAPTKEILLMWRDDSLWLIDGRTNLRPVRVDFLTSWEKLRFGAEDLLAKAVGVRRGTNQVVDATLGWGQDALRLLKLGLHVVGFERSPVLYALLWDGLRRARQASWWRQQVEPRFQIYQADAVTALPTLTSLQRQVIFLDPMFPERRKGALAKGEMQILQNLFAQEEPKSGADLSQLWSAAWTHSERRVVAKSPRLSPSAFGQPALQFRGKSVRYDVWLKT